MFGIGRTEAVMCFRAGAATGNITPELGGEVIGGFRPFPATHVHDDLWVRALVLESGTTSVAFAVCDLLGVSSGVSTEARRLIRSECGIPESHVLVAATHTHSACSALGDRFATQPEGAALNAYQRFVVRRIADAVRCAVNNLAPAQIGWATASEPRHVFNRRWYLKPGTMPPNPFGSTNDLVKMNPTRGSPDLVRPAGPTDPEIVLLAVRTPDGQPIAVLANYSLHYVGGVRGADISADYYGMFAAKFAELLGAGRQDPPFVAILSNGTSGDINNIDFTRPGEPRKPYERMREVTDDVARAAHAAFAAIRWHDGAPLGAAYREVELGFRRPTPEQLAWARVLLAEAAEAGKPKSLERIYAERTCQVAETPERAPVPIQAFRVGGVGIAALPAEVFCEIGLELKARSPFKPSFTISLAHGYLGYLPTVEQHALGGYETWLGTCRLEVGAAPKLVSEVLALWESLLVADAH